MIFQTNDFGVDYVKQDDLSEIVQVYNSNRKFLEAHMNKEKISEEWILEELKSMKEAGFYSSKIVVNSSSKIIGVMDYKLGEETYLSLMMLHNNLRGNGIGQMVFRAFEEYLKSLNSKSIRIDVVTDYDNSVFDFWNKNGFIKCIDVELNWTGKILSAVTMRKCLTF